MSYVAVIAWGGEVIGDGGEGFGGQDEIVCGDEDVEEEVEDEGEWAVAGS